MTAQLEVLRSTQMTDSAINEEDWIERPVATERIGHTPRARELAGSVIEGDS